MTNLPDAKGFKAWVTWAEIEPWTFIRGAGDILHLVLLLPQASDKEGKTSKKKEVPGFLSAEALPDVSKSQTY